MTGDRVNVPGGHPATVVAQGACGWHGCRNGDDCVTVREDRYSTTTNYRPESLRPRDVPER